MREFVKFCLRTVLKLMKAKCKFDFDISKLPNKGVYVANHVSYLDPILLFAFLPGNPVFALNGHLYRRHWISFLMRCADVIQFNPIEPSDIKKLIAKVDEGRQVVIFAEGRITDNGGLMKIYEAPGLVADKSGAPLIPIWIDGPQYGYFSKTKGHLPHRPLPKMRIYVGKPRKFKLKDELRRQRDHISNEVYMILREMGFGINYNKDISLFAQLMKTAKVYSRTGWFSKRPRIIEDINRKQKSYKDIIVASLALGKMFKKLAARDENVGVLLPNAIATVCTFFGLSAYERTPVMINFSVGSKNMVSMCKTALVKTVLTSKAFIIKGKLEQVIEDIQAAGVKIVYLEDLAKKMPFWVKLSSFIDYKIKHVPHKIGGNKKAVIVFTSGSEGAPKAVLLSHANLIANVNQLAAIQTVTHKDLLFNALPMFHSFGLMVGMLFPLFQGSKLFLYPSPLHYRVVAELVYELGATLMIGTDTFLRGYAKIAHPYDFHTIRLMYSGGEAAKADTRSMWMEHSGVRMMEAYGSTECSPVMTANNGIFNKFGSIGKLLPGMQYKIMPVDGIETGGELCVKGPNVMLGYYMPDNPGVLVPPADGWYHTGDVVDIDEIGFFTIKDRIKRFAKIGGEMVSLNAVQDMVIDATKEMLGEYNYGVVAVPHESKGEQIVLVTNNKDVTSALLHAYVKANGMSELYLPRVILYHDKLPVFATGKSDNVTLKKEVMEELFSANERIAA